MACWRESKEKWLRDGRSKLADASPLTAHRAWLQTADRSGTRTTKRWQPQCSLNPSHKDTYSNEIVNSPMELQIFETDITHDREDFFTFCFFCTWSTRSRQVTVQKACAYDVRKALIRDLLISIHKTRGFEWQTAHTKGCLEDRCETKESRSLETPGGSVFVWVYACKFDC